MKKYAIFLGKWASILGVCLGLIEAVFGRQILNLVGNKSENVLLGFITMFLSSVILYFVYYAKKHQSLNTDHKLGVIMGMLIPAGICFTTIGILWYIPGTLIILSAGGLSYEYWFSSLNQDNSGKRKKGFTLSKFLDIFCVILILCSILLGLSNLSTGLFHSHVLISNSSVSYDILPIDFIRVIDESNLMNPTKYNESLPVMLAYILFIIAEVILIISVLEHSIFFKKIALIMMISGLTQFIILLPRELNKVEFPTTNLFLIYGYLGFGFWMIFFGAIILGISLLLHLKK